MIFENIQVSRSLLKPKYFDLSPKVKKKCIQTGPTASLADVAVGRSPLLFSPELRFCVRLDIGALCADQLASPKVLGWLQAAGGCAAAARGQ